MIEYILWFISFVSLFVSLVWFSTFYLSRPGLIVEKKAMRFPKVTIGVPAYNEEESVVKTLKSLLDLDYPTDRLEIIVVDDGSTDDTYGIVSKFIRNSGAKNIALIKQENSGKAAALNTALKNAHGELFGCVDADSTVSRDSLMKIVQHFSDEKVGAVVSTIRVRQEKNLLQKLQRFEYLFTSFFRKLFSAMDTLYVTPGVLSVYRKSVLLKLGGFDVHNATEDLEMGLRLQYHKYKVLFEIGSKTFTDVPETMKEYYRQRIRWLRGHVYNSIKYRDMFFNPEYGFMGMFQFPLNLFSPLLMLISASVISYGIIDRIYWFALRISVVPSSIFQLNIPTIREIVLGAKIPIIFPLFVIIALGVFLYHQAHKYLKERWTFPFAFIIFLIIYPVIAAYLWMAAIAEEIFRAKRKW